MRGPDVQSLAATLHRHSPPLLHLSRRGLGLGALTTALDWRFTVADGNQSSFRFNRLLIPLDRAIDEHFVSAKKAKY